MMSKRTAPPIMARMITAKKDNCINRINSRSDISLCTKQQNTVMDSYSLKRKTLISRTVVFHFDAFFECP